jgi:hypothetical protein
VSVARPTGAWATWFRVQYRLIRVADPLVRWWLRRAPLADTIDLVVVGRRSGRPRPVLVGLLEVGGHWYVGHPNGPAQWTRNLAAAGRAIVRRRGLPDVEVAVEPLVPGVERSAVVRATFVQHPFPGNIVYRVAGRHVEAVGVFFRLSPVERPGPVGGSAAGGQAGRRWPAEPGCIEPADGPSSGPSLRPPAATSSQSPTGGRPAAPTDRPHPSCERRSRARRSCPWSSTSRSW